MSKKLDPEIEEYRNEIGKEAYSRLYCSLYTKTMLSQNTRYSGKTYTNSKERLEQIKEKYKHGVTKAHIDEMLGINGVEDDN